jgi:orotate phosphoribosyltransferase
VVVFLSYVGLLSVCEAKGWHIFVPNFYLRKKEEDHKKNIEQHMKQYFENDMGFIVRYNNDRIEYFMAQLGLSERDTAKISQDIIRLRMKPLRNLENAKEKMKDIIRYDYAVRDTTKHDPAELTYKDAQLFINLVDLSFLKYFAQEMAQSLGLLILDKLSHMKFDKIIIPHSSNFLIGFELGKILKKPVVIMRQDEGRFLRDQKWDGNLVNSDRVIIAHDVLVTGTQIKQAMDNIRFSRDYASCEFVSVFCLIKRKEWDGKREDLENLLKSYNGVKIYSLLDVNDEDIAELRRKNCGC